VDLGSKRIGLAVSDELRFTARPLGVVSSVGPRRDARAIREMLGALEVSYVLVGLPLLPSGDEGAAAVRARERAADLAARLKLPYEMVDERETTLDAQQALIASGASRKRRRRAVDAMAALVLLEGWLAERAR
jgi:putative Holliday junction resolvase